MSTYQTSFDNGVDASAGYGLWYKLTVGGTWAAADTWSGSLALLGGTYTFGTGRVDLVEPDFLFTFKNRVYATVGTDLFFSANGDVSAWERQTASAGIITITDYTNNQEDIQALSSYQGKLAVFARNVIQIWTTDPDPAEFDMFQELPNIGTVAPLSVKSLGDMDTLFLSDTGIRSLKVADETLRGIVTDVGSPIDELIQDALEDLTDAQKATACAAVEPGANRYWLYLDGDIYVLSYFVTSGVSAWSTYKPTYDLNGTQTTFTPTKFVSHGGTIYCRAGDKIIAYDNSYDGCVATAETNWMDSGAPDVWKNYESLSAAMEGAWKISLATDPKNETMTPVIVYDSDTFAIGDCTCISSGTHAKLKLETTGDEYARVSSALLRFS